MQGNITIAAGFIEKTLTASTLDKTTELIFLAELADQDDRQAKALAQESLADDRFVAEFRRGSASGSVTVFVFLVRRSEERTGCE